MNLVELFEHHAPTQAVTDPNSRALLRAQITSLEELAKKEIQANVPLTHRFSKGVYAREIVIPKGALVIGAIHKFSNMNIISKGDVSFFSIDGILRVKAPHSFVASPGVKRVIYAHEETVWTTLHGTNETDVDKIEEIFIAKDYSDVDGIPDDELKLIEEARKCLG